MKLGIQVLLKFPPENRREFIRAIEILPHFNGYKKNCTFSRLFEDVGKLNRFFWVEYWRNEKSMEEYLLSDRFKTFMGAIETLGDVIDFKKVQIQNMKS